jgi:hypothetical protein
MMAGTDSLNERLGGTRLPLDVSDVDDSKLTFEPLDPALDVLSQFLATSIRSELGTGSSAAWYKVTSALPDVHRLYQSTDPVGSVWKLGSDGPNPTLMRQIKADWPLLAVWRDGPAEFEQRTMTKELIRQKWGVMWAMSDYEADLQPKLGPALVAVARIITGAVNEGRHPSYDSGSKQFGADNGWLSRLAAVSYEAGAAKFSDDEEGRWWAASVTLESEEIVRYLDEGDDSGTTSLGVTAGVGDALEILPDLVLGDGDYPGT